MEQKKKRKMNELFNGTKMISNLHSQVHFHSRSCLSAENSLLLQPGVVISILFLLVTFIFLIFLLLVHRSIQTVPVLVFFLFHRCGIVSHCKLMVPFPNRNRWCCWNASGLKKNRVVKFSKFSIILSCFDKTINGKCYWVFSSICACL